ncbi:MAG: small subunit ribosomal protein, partial [Actinomycetota bacterium]|nr:small subunit ribosomal protein [Actinomycetota bacterium]
MPARCRSAHPHARPDGTSLFVRLEHNHLVATKIKLMRLGKMRAPYYRIVVADARTKRDGRSIETIGKYHPKEDPSFIQVDSDRAQYWLGVGAQPTDAVAAIFRVTGDWQKFKGEPAPPPMLVAAPKADKKAVFEAAAREGIDGAASGAATTPKKKAAPKKAAEGDAAPTEAAAADETPAPEAAAPEAAAPEAAAPEAAAPEAAAPEAAAPEAA